MNRFAFDFVHYHAPEFKHLKEPAAFPDSFGRVEYWTFRHKFDACNHHNHQRREDNQCHHTSADIYRPFGKIVKHPENLKVIIGADLFLPL